ncbi:ABC transporter permease [Virgibacillus byunsanensis]|uniref:ABC transporter permease n=1 Tax=Virgibacillus byunsanensis TaxID=570945 RepID=A0ABW3LQ11_9BACI
MINRKTKRWWNVKEWAPHILTFVVIIALWEGVVRGLNVSNAIFPTATDTFASLINFFKSTESLIHIWATLSETLLGFLIGGATGAILGILIAEIPSIKKLVFPFVLAFNSIPKMAMAPLFLVWFGYGISSKVAIVVVTSFFPVLINMMVGLNNIDKSQIKLLQAYSASSWQIFRRVKLPGSLPYLFAGLEIAIVFSVIGAIVSELVGANKGLGYLMLFYNSQFKVAEMFSVLVVMSIMGYLLVLCIQIIAGKVVFWQGKSSRKSE